MKAFDLPPVLARRLNTAMTGVMTLLLPYSGQAQPDPNWLNHDRSRPLPAVVDPGTVGTPERPGQPPSDAVVLFDGKDLSQWVALDGRPTQWVIRDGAMECVPGSGYIRTLQCFGDSQFHIEWATPASVMGEGQGRGNSGVFFGLNRYEVQVLDSHNNKTYADGSAASIYGQYPPLVNASRSPGEWQSYDIIWKAPRFGNDGELLARARVTVIHNGVLVQNNVELTGPTSWLERAPYIAHPEKLPIAFQDHGNPVRYRNIWIRELGEAGKPEFMLPDALLDTYTGDYERTRSDTVHIRRAPDGRLSLSFNNATFLMHAESPTRFFARTTDVQCEFQFTDREKAAVLSVGEGGMRIRKME